MDKDTNTGGPAFPVPGMPPVGTGDPRDGMAGGCDPMPGMTLRDYFAGQALAGFSASGAHASPDHWAAVSYKIANSMLAAREAKQ